jgi:hypothetical protein
MISFILTPFILIGNVFGYLTSLSLKPNPGQPQTGAALAWLAVVVAVLPFVAIVALLMTGALGGAHPPE